MGKNKEKDFMGNVEKAKTMTGHGFTQFRLTQNLLNNLSQFEITPTAKLVLLYLSSCYNPKKADFFPKQKTIALKLGISEASVIRAICELHKHALIISERKYTNRYKFTSRIVTEPSQDEKNFTPDNLQVESNQNDILETCNLQPHEHEPKREQKKEPQSVSSYKILKEYAESMGAKNINAYINKLKRDGVDKEIIRKYKEKKNADRYAQKQYEQTQQLISTNAQAIEKACPPPKLWKELGEKLRKKAMQ